jgi:hypothetical protein
MHYTTLDKFFQYYEFRGDCATVSGDPITKEMYSVNTRPYDPNNKLIAACLEDHDKQGKTENEED